MATASLTSLPVLDFSSIDSAGTTEHASISDGSTGITVYGSGVGPTVPKFGTYLFERNGVRFGFCFVADCSSASFSKIMKLCKLSADEGHTTRETIASILASRPSREEFALFQATAMLMEYTRRFALRSFSEESVDDTDAFFQGWTVARGVRAAGGAIRIAEISAIHRTRPCNAPNAMGNRKCCGNCRKNHGNRMCVNCKGGPCVAPVFKPVWCLRCDITCYCSVECKREHKVLHDDVCKMAQVQRSNMGMERACHRCGAPDGTDGIALQYCSRCRQALYCSRKCATAAWKAGHKTDCAATPRRTGPPILARSIASSRESMMTSAIREIVSSMPDVADVEGLTSALTESLVMTAEESLVAQTAEDGARASRAAAIAAVCGGVERGARIAGSGVGASLSPGDETASK